MQNFICSVTDVNVS